MATLAKHPWFVRSRDILLLAVIASLPFSIRSNRLSIIAWIVFSVITINWSSLKDNFRSAKLIFLPSLLLFVNILGLLYTSNMHEGAGLVERTAILLVFPLVFVMNGPITKEKMHQLLMFFVYVCVISCLYCIAFAIWNIVQTGGLVDQAQISDREYYYFLNKELTVNAIDISPIYFGMFLNLCIAYLLYKIFYRAHYNRWDVIMCLFVVIFQFLVISLNAMACLGLITILTAVWVVQKQSARNRNMMIAGLAVVAIVTVISLVAIKPFHDRIFVNLSYDIQAAHVSYWNGITMRLAVLECAWDTIKEAPLWGLGTGDANDALQSMYTTRGFEMGLMLGLNAHNQYIQSYLMQGVFGLLTLIAVVFIPLWHAFKKSNWLLMMLQVIIALACVTEVIFSTQKGIVFFGLFYSILLSVNVENLHHNRNV